MASVGTERIRNVVVMAHGGAGKTSLVEALAHAAGATGRLGRVEDGTTVSDYDPEEQQRGMSVNTSVVSLDHDGHRLNLLDTPGYADFLGELVSAGSVADSALLVVDAASGIQVGTEVGWRTAARRNLPRAIVVNRLDKENADFEATLAALQATFGPQCQAVNLPIGSETSFSGVVDVLSGQAYLGADATPGAAPAEAAAAAEAAREALVERIAEADDDLTLKYLEGEALTDEEIADGLKQAILGGSLVPVLAAAATAEVGVQPLLRLLTHELPSPLEAPAIRGAEGDIAADPEGATVVFVFKTIADEFVGRVTYLRVISGTLKSDDHLENATSGDDERMANLSHTMGKEMTHADQLVAGDIGVVTKLSHTTTFDTLRSKGCPLAVARPAMPAAVFSAAITPRTKADVDKLGPSLQRLIEEDPTLHLDRDHDTHDTIISGLGESHVQLAAEKLARKFKVEVDISDRRIPYRETVTTVGQAEYLHKKQTGGHGQYARVALRVEPLDRGAGFEFADEVVGGSVPRNYIPAVEKGVMEALPNGTLGTYPLTDVRVVLFDGKHHDVDSSEMAFKLAASQALKEATAQARPILLEPIMDLKISVPEASTGDVMSDLNARRARVLGMEPSEELAGNTVVHAEGPMAEFLRYATDLRSMTGGRGTFGMEFLRYDPLPEHVAQKVRQEAELAAAAS